MTEVELREAEDLAIPAIGEVVSLGDAKACSLALDSLRELEKLISYHKTVLTRAIVAEAERQGSRTIELSDRRKAVVIPGDRTTYDAGKLVDLLREAGMPEKRISEIVQEEVSYVVVANELKKAARANARYAEILEATKTVEHRAPTVAIRRR